MKKGFVATLGVVVGAVIGGGVTSKVCHENINEKNLKVDKFKGYYNMLNQWLVLKQKGQSLEKYFVDHNYKVIAIYGMGEMGNRLYDELKNTSIEIKYAVDKEAANTYSELEVLDKDVDFENVDAMVVTATFAFSEIEEELQKKVEFPIVSLEDVVYEV